MLRNGECVFHYDDAIMSAIASQITSLTIVYSIVYSDADQRKHQSSASLAFVRGIHRVPVNSPHKWPVTRKMFPFDDVIIVINYSNSRDTVWSEFETICWQGRSQCGGEDGFIYHMVLQQFSWKNQRYQDINYFFARNKWNSYLRQDSTHLGPVERT